jgi:hypothetical protein
MTPTVTSNLGRWKAYYHGLDADAPQAYGDTRTYHLASEWLAGCSVVEDWGCGKGYFGSIHPGEVVGVDGTRTPFSHVVKDLAKYRSDVPGIHLRHVLEHDPRWLDILHNALTSAAERMVLTLFTPLADETQQIAWNDLLGVPDLAFAAADLEAPMVEHGWEFTRDTMKTDTQYEVETMWRLSR